MAKKTKSLPLLFAPMPKLATWMVIHEGHKGSFHAIHSRDPRERLQIQAFWEGGAEDLVEGSLYADSGETARVKPLVWQRLEEAPVTELCVCVASDVEEWQVLLVRCFQPRCVRTFLLSSKKGEYERTTELAKTALDLLAAVKSGKSTTIDSGYRVAEFRVFQMHLGVGFVHVGNITSNVITSSGAPVLDDL